jgi:hypothetical protein
LAGRVHGREEQISHQLHILPKSRISHAEGYLTVVNHLTRPDKPVPVWNYLENSLEIVKEFTENVYFMS